MCRSLILLFRRDCSRDHVNGNVPYEGYQILWPSGEPVSVGLSAFCKHGQRLFGLGRHLEGSSERLVELLCFPLASREADLTRIAGHRVRRFRLKRAGHEGRIYFLDDTPTTVVFDADRDDTRIVDWIGLGTMQPGEERWLDLAARTLSSSASSRTEAKGDHRGC